MKRRLRAYKKTVSIVNEKAIELYKGLGIEKKGFLLEGTDKESGQYTFMGVEPNEIIQSDKDSLVITRKDGSREVREGNPLIRLKEYFDEFEIVKDPGELDFIGGLVRSTYSCGVFAFAERHLFSRTLAARHFRRTDRF